MGQVGTYVSLFSDKLWLIQWFSPYRDTWFTCDHFDNLADWKTISLIYNAKSNGTFRLLLRSSENRYRIIKKERRE